MKLTVVIIKLFFLSAMFLISNYDLRLADSDDRAVFFDLYYNWIGSLVNQGLDVTGYVVKFEWLPETQEGITKESLLGKINNMKIEG